MSPARSISVDDKNVQKVTLALLAVAEKAGCSIVQVSRSRVADVAGVPRGTASAALRRMVQAGWVRVVPGPAGGAASYDVARLQAMAQAVGMDVMCALPDPDVNYSKKEAR